MQRYLHETGAPRQAFAGFPLRRMPTGSATPMPCSARPSRLRAIARPGMVSDPLNLFDVAPNADGAAAVLLTRARPAAARISRTGWCGLPAPARSATPWRCTTGPTRWLSRPPACQWSAPASKPASSRCRRICSSCAMPISIYAVLSLEAAGFAQRGQGWKLAEDGCLDPAAAAACRSARWAGSKRGGNPGGATGVYQAVEAVLQLRGQAGANQLPQARRAPDPMPGRAGFRRRHPRVGSAVRRLKLLAGF